ncbi:MAG TPA: DUF1192 domain-containing protein [Alphaproteobacteria bacterium]|nr:DUF1192 domain-containing protein [Alphaproteobacteria bacterium]
MAIDLDDLNPRKPSVPSFRQEDLSRFSIADLDERIKDLEAEIARCRELKASKQATMANAQGLFKK